MKKYLFLLGLASQFMMAQMPNIENVWLNNSKPYVGTIGSKNEILKLKVNISEQDKKKDQEYFVSGYSLVNQKYTNFEGKFIITKYKDSKKGGIVYGNYDLAEENKGPQKGTYKGKFIYTFKWNKQTEKIENPYLELIGDWKSYDNTLLLKTRLNNQ